jgi:hypothetical protein
MKSYMKTEFGDGCKQSIEGEIQHFTSTIDHHSHLHLHLIVIAIPCNWDLLATGDLVRIFGINLSISTPFSFIGLTIMSE